MKRKNWQPLLPIEPAAGCFKTRDGDIVIIRTFRIPNDAVAAERDLEDIRRGLDLVPYGFEALKKERRGGGA